jgi:hypothetical protein
LLKWTAFGMFRAGADTEAALFTEARRREVLRTSP